VKLRKHSAAADSWHVEASAVAACACHGAMNEAARAMERNHLQLLGMFVSLPESTERGFSARPFAST